VCEFAVVVRVRDGNCRPPFAPGRRAVHRR